MNDDKIKEIEEKSSLDEETNFPEAIFKVINRVEQKLQSKGQAKKVAEYEETIKVQKLEIENLKTKIENLTIILKRYKLLTDNQEKRLFVQQGEIAKLKEEIKILTQAIIDF